MRQIPIGNTNYLPSISIVSHHQNFLYSRLKYLCVPATIVESERTFSLLGLLLTKRRLCMAGDNVNKQLFLKDKLNKKIWNSYLYAENKYVTIHLYYLTLFIKLTIPQEGYIEELFLYLDTEKFLSAPLYILLPFHS